MLAIVLDIYIWINRRYGLDALLIDETSQTNKKEHMLFKEGHWSNAHNSLDFEAERRCGCVKLFARL